MLLSRRNRTVRREPSLRAIALLLTLAAMSAPALRAQLPAGFEPICAEGQRPVINTTEVIVALKPADGFGDSTKYSPAQLTRIQYYINSIQQHFVAPPSLGALPTFSEGYVATPYESLSAPGGALQGRLVLVVKKDGRLRSQLWEYAPISNVWAITLKRAIAAADSAGDFEGIIRPDEPGVSDTLAIDVETTFTSASPQFPFMRVRIETYQTNQPAQVVKQGKSYYPAAARRAGAETDGMVMFVVGSDGRAVESLIQVVKARWIDFILPMRQMVATAVYAPARSGGCAVPAMVRQPISFALQRP